MTSLPSLPTILHAVLNFVTHARPDLTHLGMRMVVRGMEAGDPVSFLAAELNRVDGALLVASGRPLRMLLDNAPLYNVLRQFLTRAVVSRMVLLATLANNGALVEDRLRLAERFRAVGR